VYNESESYVKECGSDCIKENTGQISDKFRKFFDDYVLAGKDLKLLNKF
ncbi:29031_t:CDS:2, partial [Racocetra persica]